ncbi:MAG: DNA recombination protein RmuC [Lachnospira sp.]|nr:DNA recombination protein RmuC [Lachnospira sp.]
MKDMQFIILMCCVVSIIISVLCLTVSMKNKNTDEYKRVNQQLDMMSQTFAAQISTLYDQLNRQNNLMVNNITALGRELRESQETQQGRAKEQLVNVQNEMKELRKENREILDKIREDTLGTLDSMRKSNWESLEQLRNDNQKSLDKINDTVNEKLQKTLDDKISQSFEAVNKRLAEVYEGLGEMKKVASGVTDLKNVLSNVKTRGIMGEIQLASILSEILAPEQFAEQVVLVPGKNEKVDFAVKLPGASADKTVYLPIDSKFPGDTYANLMSAYENGDVDDIKQKRILLVNEIKKCAKSIHDKYINPPYTTDFAIMFLPFEGLYAEVVNMGLVEDLQKKSGEVWKILESAKKEFETFEDVLNKTRSRLRQADEELEKLIGVRTRAINRKLTNVTVLDEPQELD